MNECADIILDFRPTFSFSDLTVSNYAIPSIARSHTNAAIALRNDVEAELMLSQKWLYLIVKLCNKM